MPKLEPCPFCGAEPITSIRKDGFIFSRKLVQIKCDDTDERRIHLVMVVHETEEGAITAWNRRTSK